MCVYINMYAYMCTKEATEPRDHTSPSSLPATWNIFSLLQACMRVYALIYVCV